MLPVLMAFYVMGFPDIVGVATSYVKTEFGLTNTITQGLTILAFVWFALLSIPVGVFQDKHSKRITVILGIIFIAMGMLAPIIIPFNLIKAGINSAIALIIFKAIGSLIKR